MEGLKKRLGLAGKIVIGILIIIFLLIAFGIGVLWLSLNKIHRIDEYEQIKYENTFQGKNILNILLIGEDRRPGEERMRSDSIIVMTVDKENKVIKLRY